MNILRTVVLILVNVAFITLLERKILGLSQLRLGPNKPSVIGIAQPGADAIKLFLNFNAKNFNFQYVYSGIPLLSIFLVFLIWLRVPLYFNFSNLSFGIIYLLSLFRLTIYPLILAGWRSMNKYSFLGAIRGIAQTISYEVRLALIFILPIIYRALLNTWGMKGNFLLNFLFPFISGLWLITALSESGRTPFDFAEGESELVSGFNTEYRRRKFAFIFMAEYARIFFLRSLTGLLLLNLKNLFSPLIIVSIIFVWVWVRATLPRHRFDFLINLNWIIILPRILIMIIFYIRLCIF